MTQTTPEEPTLISPASETEAKPYTRPAKKSHVPAGMDKLILAGLALLVALLVVVLIFSHKMSPTKSHGQASKRTPAQQQTTATTGVMPADENNTPSAATGNDPDSITPKDILATKNALEAQKRHAKEAEEAAAKPAGTGTGVPRPPRRLCWLHGANLKAIQWLPENDRLHRPLPAAAIQRSLHLPVNLPVGLGLSGRNIKPEPPIASQCAHGMMR